MFRILYFVIFTPFFVIGQNKQIDSVKLEITKAKHDTLKCKNYNYLGESIYIAYPDSAFNYWSIAKKLAEKNLANDQLNALTKRTFLNYLGVSQNNIGYIYQSKGNVLKAKGSYQESLKIWKSINGDQTQIASVLNNLGLLCKNLGDIPKALEYYNEALKIFETNQNKTQASFINNNLAMIYLRQGDINKAVEFFNNCLKIQKSINNKNGMAVVLLNLGSCYQKVNNIDKTIECINESLRLSKEIGDDKGTASALNNLGQLLIRQKKYKDAFGVLEQCIHISEKSGDKKSMMIAKSNMTTICLNTGDLKKAYDNAITGLEMAEEMGYPIEINSFALSLKQIYIKQKKFKEALAMAELEVKMKDSIQNTTNRKASIKSQLKYEYEKQSAADSVAHAKESEIKNAEIAKQTAEIKAKKNQQYALFGGLGLVMVFAGLMYNRFKITQKQKVIIESQKQVVEEQKKIVEEKQKEILDSIHYARRIQMAQIPSEKRVSNGINRLKK